MKKQPEASFGIKLRHWFRANHEDMPTQAIECKQTSTNTFLLSNIKEAQLNFALAIRSKKGVMIRIQGGNGEPDYIWLKNELSYIWIKYPAFFCGISPEAIVKEMKTSKSLTAKRAKEIASVVV
jgi:penicillin-binding protein-related factor A (putative recombinase)